MGQTWEESKEAATQRFLDVLIKRGAHTNHSGITLAVIADELGISKWATAKRAKKLSTEGLVRSNSLYRSGAMLYWLPIDEEEA